MLEDYGGCCAALNEGLGEVVVNYCLLLMFIGARRDVRIVANLKITGGS
jgi:hypothetical protein